MNADEARRIKDGAVTRVAQAFTNPVRVRMLGILDQGEATVEVLAAKTGQTGANASAQLRHLAAAHLVVARRDGRHIYYRLASPGVRRLLRTLQEEAALADPELRELARDWFDAPFDPAAGEALLDRVRHGEVVLLDVRPADEFAHGHLPGARNVPADALEDAATTLSAEAPVVVYCRGRFCLNAAESVRRLRARGLDVTNLSMGVTDWAAAGLPIEAPTR